MPAMARTLKQQVRAERRALRRTLAAERDLAADDQALAAALEPLLDALAIGPGDVVTAYQSLPVEPPTEAVCRLLAARGAQVIVPITLVSYDLDWFDLADAHERPLGVDAVAAARLLLVPALAVDATGTRLGQAGGCYDRTLPRVNPDSPVVALLHPGEFSADLLPRDPWDMPVTAVLTADGYRALTARDPHSP